MSGTTKRGEVKYSELVCIGLGLSGIGVGVQLKRKWNFKDMHFYDRNKTHSGTWCVNRYPGAACDVPIFLYSYSFAQRAWSRRLPPAKEIRNYISGVVEEYNLEPYMTFQTECEEAIWDKERSLWILHMRNIISGETFIHECRILFSAVGLLSQPHLPDIPGMKTFEGESFHSARWKEEVSLDGKDVVVIGNGCTATQIIPQIVSKAKSVTQIGRTPHWIFDFPDAQFSPGLVQTFKKFPLLSRVLRLYYFGLYEFEWLLFPMNKLGASRRKKAEDQSRAYIQEIAPEKYQDLLIPNFEVACKRRVLDSNRAYLKALHSNNLLLTKDIILEIKPNGVLTDKKFYPADVIVYATGFRTNKDLGQLRIKGENGLWLEEYWNEQGGPSAYNSLCVAGYPNFFMLYGPNSNTGHTSVIITVENAINGAFKLLVPILKGEAIKVEVKKMAYERWAESVQKATKTCVFFAGGCNTWYVSGSGWNGTTYPWSQIHFWWRQRFPNWKDWEYTYNHKRSRFGSKFWTTTTLLTMGGFAVRYYYYGSNSDVFDLVNYVTTTCKELFQTRFS